MKNKKGILILAIASFFLLLNSYSLNAQTSFTLNKQGVGCLKKGMLFTKIPASCTGLYDRFEKQRVENEMDGDYTLYIFYSGKEKVAEIADYGYEKTVSGITVYSSKVSTTDGVYPGMEIKKLLTFKGVKGNYSEGLDLELNGYTIGFDGMSAQGSKAFNDAYAAGTAVKLSSACFKAGAKVVSITY